MGLGAFLSGGTDSSTVTGMMARTGRGAVKTFSIGFREQTFNELDYAKITAKRFHTKHHTYLVGPEDCFQALPEMVRSFDEPFGNSSAIPTYFCARLAAENGVKALLAGDGGDELFGGNAWYATDKIFDLYQSVPSALRKGLIEPVLSARVPVENGLVSKARNYIRRSNMPGLERVLSYHFLCAHPPARIFEGDFLETIADYSVLDVPYRYYRQAPARDHLDRMLYMDVKIVLGDSDLPKVTTMSELAGVQARFPFLDRAVAEFSGCIPANLKVKGFEKRYLFKRAFKDLLPAEIVKRKKHGFGIPVATWLKSHPKFREFSRDTLLSRRAFQRGYFRRDFIEDLFRKHESDDTSLLRRYPLDVSDIGVVASPGGRRAGGDSRMKIVEVRQETDLQELASDWEKLLCASSSNTIFLTWDWITAWWSAYGAPGELRILTAYDDNGTLCGIAPLRAQTKRRYGQKVSVWSFIGAGSNDSDYLDCIVASGCEEWVMAAFRQHWVDGPGSRHGSRC